MFRRIAYLSGRAVANKTVDAAPLYFPPLFIPLLLSSVLKISPLLLSSRTAASPSAMSSQREREGFVYKAKLAEQAERYEGKSEFPPNSQI